jgi:hypothetical protein
MGNAGIPGYHPAAFFIYSSAQGCFLQQKWQSLQELAQIGGIGELGAFAESRPPFPAAYGDRGGIMHRCEECPGSQALSPRFSQGFRRLDADAG